MFSDYNGVGFSCTSSWAKQQVKEEASTQCNLIQSAEEEVQTELGNEIGIQTEPIEATNTFNIKNNVDTPELRSFLVKISPMVEAQLDKNITSHAFDDYDPYRDLEGQYNVTAQHELTYSKLDASVTAVAWNCTGAILAVAYGKFDHTGWCTHSGALCTWSVFRRNMDPTKPDAELDTGGCVQSVSFHPKRATWVAVGTFHGGLMVWDIDKPDDIIFAPSSEHAHSDPISRIHWIDGPTKLSSQIVTIGGDGKVLLWSYSKKAENSIGQIELLRGFALLNKRAAENLVAGGTAMSFSLTDPNVFVVGTEGGRVYKCSISSSANGTSSSTTSTIVGNNPITFSYDPHIGPVQSLDFSPRHRNLFLSCSTDATVRLYSMLKTRPLVTFSPSSTGFGYLYDVAWSPARPLVFAVASDDGHLYIYDLLHNRAAPSVTLRADSPMSKASVYTLSFNEKNPEYIATGDSKGIVKVWQLSQYLSREQTHEKNVLNKLGDK